MASYNKVILLGNLTRDPQLSYTPSQTAVVDFGLATNRRWKAQDGSQRDETCFVDCKAFGRIAENINKYCKKGRPLLVEGRLTFDSWTAQDGSKRSKLRVTVETFTFVDSGSGGGQRNGGQSQSQSQSQSQGQGQEYSNSGQVDSDVPNQQAQPSSGPEAPFNPDDDIPF